MRNAHNINGTTKNWQEFIKKQNYVIISFSILGMYIFLFEFHLDVNVRKQLKVIKIKVACGLKVVSSYSAQRQCVVDYLVIYDGSSFQNSLPYLACHLKFNHDLHPVK